MLQRWSADLTRDGGALTGDGRWGGRRRHRFCPAGRVTPAARSGGSSVAGPKGGDGTWGGRRASGVGRRGGATPADSHLEGQEGRCGVDRGRAGNDDGTSQGGCSGAGDGRGRRQAGEIDAQAAGRDRRQDLPGPTATASSLDAPHLPSLTAPLVAASLRLEAAWLGR